MLQETLKLLREAKLHSLASSFNRWCRNPANLHKSHVECLHSLAVSVAAQKQTRRIDTFLRRARLSQTVAIANVWTEASRGLTAGTLANLATCTWVDEGTNLIIVGDHGTGKTFLAGALAREAALTRHGVVYQVLSKLMDTSDVIDAAKLEKLVAPLRRANLLVLDHVAEDFIEEHQCTLLRDLLDERMRKGLSTIVVSSRPVEEWEIAFANPDHAEAIIQRITRQACTIRLGKEKPRKVPKRRGLKPAASH